MDENVTPPPPPPLASPTGVAAPPPPPPLSPPPVIVPAAPNASRRGRGWMPFAIILLVLLAISVLFNFSALVSNLGGHGRVKYSRSVGPKLEEVTAEDNGANDKIALVEVNGIITSHLE